MDTSVSPPCTAVGNAAVPRNFTPRTKNAPAVFATPTTEARLVSDVMTSPNCVEDVLKLSVENTDPFVTRSA